MALRLHVSSPFFLSISTHRVRTTRISCTGSGGDGGISDATLSSELAVRVARMNAHSAKAEEAMRKSRKLLFGELCEYMGLKEEEAQKKWTNMNEDQKLVIVKAFLKDWGSHFHPLSARSTRDMLEEYLLQRNAPPITPTSTFFLQELNRIIGFP